MSKKQNNQDEENVNTEQGDSMNGEKDQENLENSQENSESGAGTEVNESNEEAVQEETQDDLDALDDLTKEEILEFKKKAAERDTYLDQLLRTKAEFMNYQKRMVKERCKYAVVEVTSHALTQSRVLGINFDVGVLTNVTSDHVEYHGSFNHYLNYFKI